jgi:hypothetical protein
MKVPDVTDDVMLVHEMPYSILGTWIPKGSFGWVAGKHIDLNNDLSERILAYDVNFKFGSKTYQLRCRPGWIIRVLPPVGQFAPLYL